MREKRSNGKGLGCTHVWGKGWSVGRGHGRMNYRHAPTLNVGFPVKFNRLCGIAFNRFLYTGDILTHGWYFWPILWTVTPWMKELYLCTATPLPSLWPPPHLWGGGGGCWVVLDHILQEFYTLFLTRFRSYKISTTPQTKMTSKDDI
jgi:hypothetical protein